MTDKARFAAAGAMSNVRTAIDSAKRIGFTGNSVSLIVCSCLFTIDSTLLHQQRRVTSALAQLLWHSV